MSKEESGKRIKGLQDLARIKEDMKAENALREDGWRARVTVHMGTCGIASGAREVVETVMDELSDSGRKDIRVTTSGCIGACANEPVMTVEVLGSEPVLYGNLDSTKVREIFNQHAVNGRMVPKWAMTRGTE